MNIEDKSSSRNPHASQQPAAEPHDGGRGDEGAAPRSRARSAAGADSWSRVTVTEKAEREDGAGGVRFTLDDAQKASDAWGFNCGPGALCALLDMTPDELRPHLLDFESKGYTNPTLMLDVLTKLGAKHRTTYRSDLPGECHLDFGAMRVQWAGPWTKPGVPMRVRYRQTHWVGVRTTRGFVEVFDVNAMVAGGWLSYQEWAHELVPWLIRECCAKGTGEWWPTHGIEVSLAGRAAAAGEWRCAPLQVFGDGFRPYRSAPPPPASYRSRVKTAPERNRKKDENSCCAIRKKDDSLCVMNNTPTEVNQIVGGLQSLNQFKNRYVVCVETEHDGKCAEGQGDGFTSLKAAKAWAKSAICMDTVTVWDTEADKEVYRA